MLDVIFYSGRRKCRRLVQGSAVAMVMLAAGVVQAQETSRFTFDVGGGFTQPIGRAGSRLDTGWNIRGGAGYNFNRWVGASIGVGYNRFDLNGATLSQVGFPGGNVQVFSATLDPIVHLTPGRHGDAYLVGGAGLYRVEQQFTQPSVTTVLGFDPFFGFYNVAVPITEVLSSYSMNKPGFNIGAGFAMGAKWRGKFFAEARFTRIITGNDRHADYIPVTFGYRW